MTVTRWFGPLPVVAVVAFGACGVDTEDGASLIDRVAEPIVGGQAASACMWPTCVQAGGCTNTLVNPRLVISAGH
jgi:hypothetical protein